MLPKSIKKLSYYVNDFSGVLSKKVQLQQDKIAQDIDMRSHLQAIVVIFPHRQGKDLKDIALEVFNTHGIGQKGKNNGLLLIISSEEKKIRIMTGKGLEWIYSDIWCQKLIENKLRPLVNAGNYSKILEVWHKEVTGKLFSNTYNNSGKNNKKSFTDFNIKHKEISLGGAIISSIIILPILYFYISLIPILIFWSILLLLLFILYRQWRIFLIQLFIVSLYIFCIGWFIGETIIQCRENPIACQSSSSSSSSSSSYKSSSSSSSSWGSSSSSSNSSSSSFGGGGGSSNGGGWGD